MKAVRIFRSLVLFAFAATLLNGCKSEESLDQQLQTVDRAVYRPHSKGQVHPPFQYVNPDTLATLKKIPFGDTCPAMKCSTDGILVFLAGNDTVLEISLTLQDGCMTATFLIGEELKSVWLSGEASSLLTTTHRKSTGLSNLENLKWILGKWTQTDPDGSISFENWDTGGNGSLVGHSYTLKGRDTVFQETLEILSENGTIYYVANVKENAGPVRFRMSESGPGFATFENKAHDFPQIITYTAKGDSGIVATISGTKNGQFGRAEFPLKRVDE